MTISLTKYKTMKTIHIIILIHTNLLIYQISKKDFNLFLFIHSLIPWLQYAKDVEREIAFSFVKEITSSPSVLSLLAQLFILTLLTYTFNRNSVC